MKLIVGNHIAETQILNDDGSRIDAYFTNITIDISVGEFPEVRFTGFLPAGSEIQIDNRTIVVQEHPDNADLHSDS